MSEDNIQAPEAKKDNPFNIPGYVPNLQPVAEAAVAETPEARMARLRALAQVEIDKETDAEIVAQMVADERARRAQELLPIDTSGWPADYDIINIYKGQNKQDKNYVELSLNGYCIKAPRGRNIIIPHVFVTECLDHAVEDITEQSAGGLVMRASHRFPYQFVGKATPDAYKAFQVQERELADRQLNQARISA